MGVLNKIMTAIRGGAREAGEAIVDANAIRIFEQEIKDAENSLRKAKHDLTEVMAKQMQAQREVKRLQEQVSQHETYAAQALEKSDESLALEIANKVASLEQELAEQQEVHTSFAQHAERLKALVKKSERAVKEHQRQLTMVKTTQSVQKATASVTDNFAAGHSKLNNAKESLERIRQRQMDFDDKLKAAEDLQDEASDKSLEARMQAAGIGKTANDGQSVLARLKAKQERGSA